MATIDPTQSVLELGDLSDDPVEANDDAVPEGEAKKRTARSASRNIGTLPKHLPRCEEVIEPESTACPCCSSLPPQPGRGFGRRRRAVVSGRCRLGH
ncbi:hypothetical protein [Prosthecomicrobium hirschii]|uniref:hypothetical protein n=1 Tax=Prosthecodimorpha hirschii TaxID=665126 RepID=UPI0009F9DD8F